MAGNARLIPEPAVAVDQQSRQVPRTLGLPAGKEERWRNDVPRWHARRTCGPRSAGLPIGVQIAVGAHQESVALPVAAAARECPLPEDTGARAQLTSPGQRAPVTRDYRLRISSSMVPGCVPTVSRSPHHQMAGQRLRISQPSAVTITSCSKPAAPMSA